MKMHSPIETKGAPFMSYINQSVLRGKPSRKSSSMKLSDSTKRLGR